MEPSETRKSSTGLVSIRSCCACAMGMEGIPVFQSRKVRIMSSSEDLCKRLERRFICNCDFVFGFVCFVASVLFLCLDEDCNPGSGDCGRPLRLLPFVLLKMVNDYVLFVGDWTIRSNSAWSK